MNARKRWVESIVFGNPDKKPLLPGDGGCQHLPDGIKKGLLKMLQAYRDVTTACRMMFRGKILFTMYNFLQKRQDGCNV